MYMFKRIGLFLLINFLVVMTISLLLQFFNVQPYLQRHGLDYGSLAIFCLFWGVGGALISLLLSRFMAKAMLRVEVVNPSTHDPELSRLVQTVHRLSRQAHLSSMPEVGVFPSHEVNAFATGPSAKRSLVAVSSALLHKMSDKEMEGVLAHEISHITNGDMVTMTLLQGVVNAFVMFMARALAFFLSGMGKGQKRSSSSYGSYMILVLVFQIFFMILGSIVIAAFSRYREFRADRGGADLAGKDKMIAALEALKRVINIHDPATDKEAIAAFKISETKKRSGLVSLFASHPPLDERIARLKGI